ADEITSQVYNMEPNANETFSASSDWADPSGWMLHEGAGTNIWVLPRFGGYKNVLEMYDNTSTEYTDVYRDFSQSQTSGTVYATMMAKQIDQSQEAFAMAAGIGFVAKFSFNSSGTFAYGSSGSSYDSGVAYEANRWYTFKLSFDSGPEKYSVWYWNETTLSWVTIVNDVNFYQSTGTLTRIHMQGNIVSTGTVLVSAIDYSWADG
ncbi:unnamed protein product, partial [marine sediment metagenome]